MLYEIICCLLCVFAVYGLYCAAREVYFLLMTRGEKGADGDENPGCGHNCIACRRCAPCRAEIDSEESQPNAVSEEKASKD